MIAVVPSATLLGVDGRPVAVEAHVSNGLPGFHVVGLPDAACRESRDRVRAALLSSGLPWPMRRVTINLAPSGMRKAGSGLDLPIAVALLLAAGELPAEPVAGTAFVGELGLDGSIRGVPGILSLVDVLRCETVVVAPQCRREAALVGRHRVRTAGTLRELVDALRGDGPWPEHSDAPSEHGRSEEQSPDLADVRGQRLARWALEIAAAGGHHLLLTGPPGAGKTMLARRLPGLLPPLTSEEAVETTRVHSAAGLPLPPDGLVTRPPFRAPHHGASAVALVGGGTAFMRPGEASMAHNGVLFLDELGEFHAGVLDCLREPLEEGAITVARAKATVTFPARFLLVAAMNPCPCGQAGPPGTCRCSDRARARYARRLSGPLLDRFDLRIPVARPDPAHLRSGPALEPTATVAERVARVRAMAADRGARCNAQLPSERLDEAAPLTPAAWAVLERRLHAGLLSARGLHRVRRVARTLADLDGPVEVVEEAHVCAALELRLEQHELGLAS
ncbi:MAG TPA: YifB family Mg chelatase-like AAA ATPase [Acidimicrobiales bacterium]|nr:YifB family Mg chelatase-like AAA ATPase [Acidimicrobiales bacterium]